MFLFDELCSLQNGRNPVRVGLIGAGKFGSMFLAQVPTTPGVEVSIIADLDPAQAKRRCTEIGWPEELTSKTEFVDDAMKMMTPEKVDVLVEATGNPVTGVVHAQAAISSGIHIVMVNVEADVLAGAHLAKEAASAGVVYSMAYGDQPALTCELVDWARSCGFKVVAAGKGTKFLPSYHGSTPDTVWDHYGLTSEQANAAGMNSKMFNSFLDGTKSALEMAAIANATGLAARDDGLLFPPAGMDDLAKVLRPRANGGQLDASGMVEVVSSLERDGRPVFKDLRWGVYVVLEAPNDYTAACFRQYGMNTDETGRFSAMYKPFHLIGLELNISILAAALLSKATGSAKAFTGDVVATAKRPLKTGDILDGEGGYTVWGKLCSAKHSIEMNALPIGLAQGVKLKKDIPKDGMLRLSDVELDMTCRAFKLRQLMKITHN